MPAKKTAKKKVAPKIAKETSLADEILNGTPVVDTPAAIEPEVVEPVQEVIADEPEVAKIPVIDPKPYQPIKTEGTRFYMRELAGLTPHGSVGHDLLWSVKFDEHGMSEFVTEPKVIEKLRKMGWKEFKA